MKRFIYNHISSKSADNFIYFVLCISFSIATFTHLNDMLHLGFFGYTQLPGVVFWENLFWTSLIFIDPITAFLLFLGKQSGAILGFLVLAADVLINYHSISKHPSIRIIEVPSFSLQTACLLFSAVTLPVLLVKKTKKGLFKSMILFIFSNLPSLIFFTGFLIHIHGLITIMKYQMNLWNIWVHIFMTVFDFMVFLLIFRRNRIGYWAGIIAFGIFALIQSIYAGGSYLSIKISFNMEMSLYLAVCLLTIASLLELLSKEKNYILKKKDE